MNPDAIMRMFPNPVLSPVGTESDPPTQAQITTLVKEATANTTAIDSFLGGGAQGHAFLTMSAANFLALAGEAKPVAPVTPSQNPPVPTAFEPSNISTAHYRAWEESWSRYRLYHNVQRCIVNCMIKAIKNVYIAPLEHVVTGYGRVTAWEILKHLQDNYGEIEDYDLDYNEEKMKAPWAPPTTIQVLFQRMETGQRYAKTENPITDKTLMLWTNKLIKETGNFNKACEDWRDKTTKTWTTFKTHYTRADKHRREDLTTAGAGYKAANAASQIPTDDDAITAFTEATSSAISALTVATATNARHLQDLMAAVTVRGEEAPPNAPTNPRRERYEYRTEEGKLSYCWTCGITKNLAHTSKTCQRKKTGHQLEATMENKMDGSERTCK